MNDYFFITKLAISWALIKDRMVVYERDKQLFVGRFVRVSKNWNAIIEVDGKEYCLRNKQAYNMAILVSKKECEAYEAQDLHGISPQIRTGWVESCTVYPRGDKEITDKQVVELWFPHTADQAIEAFNQIISTQKNMEKIIMQRGYGKTTQLIKKSAKSGNYIVCHSLDEAIRIQSEAKKMGLDIPLPIAYEEFIEKRYHGKNISGFLIDNIEMFLQHLSDVPIRAITMCP